MDSRINEGFSDKKDKPRSGNKRKRAPLNTKIDALELFKSMTALLNSADNFLYNSSLEVIMAAGNQFTKTTFSPTLFLGKNLSEIIHPDIFSLVESTLLAALHGETGSREYYFNNEYFKISTAPVNYSDSDTAYAIAIIQNITSLKQASEHNRFHKDEANEINNILEKKNRELTESNNKLKVSEDQLRAANADKDKFFSLIAHDLRSPFSGFLTLSEYIAQFSEVVSKEELHDIATEMHKSAENVFRLIENLLQWSRLQTGNFSVHPTQFNFEQLINHNIELFGNKATEKNISLFKNVTSDLVFSSDVNMCDTILRNLLSNAIKFTKDNGFVRIKASKDKDRLIFSVSDNGIGMSKETLEGLYKLDRQNSREGTRNEKGTGLGLILTKEFIEKLGGTLIVESEPGQGSNFRVSLPIVAEV